MSGSDPTARTVLAQAADWYALLQADDVSEADRRGWRCWLDADPAHAHAWARVEAMSRRFDELPAPTDRRAASRALDLARGAGRRRVLKVMGVAGVGTLASWLAARDEGWYPVRADYRTRVGERREVTLADGSRLWLNSASALAVRFDGRQRQLALLKGELLVETAHDARRPLLVSTAQGQIHALGTRFSVCRDGGHCQVSVFDGAVEVMAGPQGQRALVHAGQQLGFDADGPRAPEAASRLREAWTRGLLVADDMRLDDFVAELSRYQVGYLACSPRVAELRLVGVFPLGDVEQVYAALERALPVRVTRRLPWWRQVDAA